MSADLAPLAARSAQQALKVEKRQRAEAETELARRERTAKKTQKDGGIPKIFAGNRASRAQGSAGALRSALDGKVESAQAAVDAADARVREEEHIRITLPDPDVPRGRRLIEFHDGDHEVVIQEPERVALIGSNGSGKSTLIEQLVHGTPASQGRAHGALLTYRIGYLPQRLAASCCAATASTARSAPSQAVNASASHSPGSCSPSRPGSPRPGQEA